MLHHVPVHPPPAGASINFLSLCPSAAILLAANIAMAAMTAASIARRVASLWAETARLPAFRNCEAYGASCVVRSAI
jgi:hypothetical protein